MNIFQNVKNQSRLDSLRSILQQIENKFKTKEVYYIEFDESSFFCVKHLGIDKDCSSYHKALIDKLERVAFEEGIPVVVLDTTKDPRTINTYLSNKVLSVLVVPVRHGNINLGTLTLIREKKFDIKDLSEVNLFAETIAIMLSNKFRNLNKNEIFKEISWGFLNSINQGQFSFDSFYRLISNLGIDLNFGFVFENGKSFSNLPCYVNNWNVLLEICPSIRRNVAFLCNNCRFSKEKGFICRSVNIQRVPFAVFSFSDFSGDFDNTWNDLIISIFSKLSLFYYSSSKLESYFIYRKIFDILKELLGTDRFTIDNIIIKIIDIFFDLFNNVAVYAYSAKSKSKFEIVKINPKYQNLSDIVYNYKREVIRGYNFNGTFSFIINTKYDKIIFDIIFINLIELKRDFSIEIEIIKNFIEFVSTINSSIEYYKSNLMEKKEEVKTLYNKTKKLEHEIDIYRENMIVLENKINYYNQKEEILKFINSLTSINDLESRISIFFNKIDSILNYKISSIIILFFNKVTNKFYKVIFSNISDYLHDIIKSKLREMEKNIGNNKLTKSLVELNIFYKGDEVFNLLPIPLGNIKSILNIPLVFSEDSIGSIMIFFSSKVDLSNDEKAFLYSLSRELSRKLGFIRTQELFEKIKYINALMQDFIEKLSFQNDINLDQIFEYFFIIMSKLGFRTLLIYKERKEFFFSNITEFNLHYVKDSYRDYDNKLKTDFPQTISLSREILYSFNKVTIFEKEKEYDNKYSFINSFLVDNYQVLFIVPFSDISYSQFSYEYSNFIAFVLSENTGYSFFEIQVFNLIHKMLSMVYNNMFLYYLNTKDKKLLFEIFDVMDDGIIVINLEKIILFINQSATRILSLNYNPEDIVNRRLKINDLIVDKVGDLIHKILNIEDLMKKYIHEGIDNVQGEASLEYEDKERIIKYNFSVLSFPIVSSSLLLDQSDNYNYLIVLKDITEQKNIEKEKDDFVATISHDIKTPLTTMKGYLSALLKYSDKVTSDQRDSYLRVVNSEIDRINRMLNNLMDLRRLEGNILDINPIKFDMIKVIKKVVDIFKVSYINFEFEIISNEESIILFLDKDKIEQVLHNLLSNAVKYSPTGGKISISVERKPKEVIVGISDQGVGIPSEEIDKIFEKYYRTRDIQKKKISGKGLGLYITKKIIELHKGKVWVQSELHKGTTFYFSLPL